MASLFSNFFCPAAFLCVIYHEIYTLQDLADDPAKSLVAWLKPLSIIQAVGMLYLIFVSFHVSPFPGKKLLWITYMPWIHALVAGLIFLLIPLSVIIVMIGMYSNIRTSMFSSILFVYAFTSFTIIGFSLPFQVWNKFSEAKSVYSRKLTTLTVAARF
jgi:hypothetical protein